MKKAELDKILKQVDAAAAKHRKMAAVLEGNPNPQMVAVYIRSTGMADAFEAIAKAFKGDLIELGIWARD